MRWGLVPSFAKNEEESRSVSDASPSCSPSQKKTAFLPPQKFDHLSKSAALSQGVQCFQGWQFHLQRADRRCAPCRTCAFYTLPASGAKSSAGAESRNLWRRLLDKRRCIVLFDGFYEWKAGNNRSTSCPFLSNTSCRCKVYQICIDLLYNHTIYRCWISPVCK